MGRIVVDIMPKPEILDPQGKAVAGALRHLGLAGFADVRQGKRFVLTVEGEVDEAARADARRAADEVLSNPIIEDGVGVRELTDDAADTHAAAAPATTTSDAR